MSTRSLPTPRSEKPETIPYLSLELWGVIDASSIDVSHSPKELLLGAAALRCCSKEHHVGLPSLAIPDLLDYAGPGFYENAHPAVFVRAELEIGHSFKAIELAAEYGRVDVVRWLRAQSSPHPRNELVLELAAGNGQLEVVKWLRAQTPPCPWDFIAAWQAVRFGRFEVLQWLREQNAPWDMTGGVCLAVKGGHLEIAEWLRRLDPARHSH